MLKIPLMHMQAKFHNNNKENDHLTVCLMAMGYSAKNDKNQYLVSGDEQLAIPASICYRIKSIL